ncbi:hypothetical protein [Chitinophaga sp. OAE865]|uniref:hypothetical protein n=1 Tax=Chitinophaga sp. OAE865 TaxID=2817898 RepID=UPI001AE6C814
MKTIRITCSMLLAATLFAVLPAMAKTTSSAAAPVKVWKPIVMKPFAVVTKTYFFNFANSPYHSLKISLLFDDTDNNLIDGNIQSNTPGVYMQEETQHTLTPNASSNVRTVNFVFRGYQNVYGNRTSYWIEGIWYIDPTGAENWYITRNTY